MSGNNRIAAKEILQLEPLLASARGKAGLSDFVDESFVEPLTRLLAAYRTEADLPEQGAQAMRMHLVDLLVTRLRIQDSIKRHPEILQEEIRGPLVVTGLPRSGTTKMQRLLASSPDLQKLPLWKIMNPVPVAASDQLSQGYLAAPERAAGIGGDPRIAQAEQFVNVVRQAFPRFYAGHPMMATEPDEEEMLMELSFKASPTYWMARIPGYQSWLQGQNLESTYRWLRMILQLVQWHDEPATRKHIWLLKAPSHIGRLDELFKVFPGATIVHCHRDPLASVPSAAAIAEMLRSFYSDKVDKHEAGRFAIDLLSHELTLYAQARERWEAEGKTFIDVQFPDIVGNIDAVVERIFRQTGLPFSEQTKSALARWEVENPQHKHGRFEYGLDDYGLLAAEIQDRFADYSARYLPAGVGR